MKSLQTVGLIHPIMVTDQLELVAGARRLEATRRLGATMIEVRRVGDLIPTEQQIIEIEENLHREELTAVQRSESQVALGELIAQQLREEAEIRARQGLQATDDGLNDASSPVNPGSETIPSVTDNNTVARGGAPQKLDSQEKVAAEMGVAQSVLSNAQQHLAAIKRYPELGAPDVSQREAIRLYKPWEAMTPPKRLRALRTWRAQQQDKSDQVGSMDQGFEDSDHLPKLVGGDIREQTGELLTQLVRAAFRVKRKQFIELHP